MPETVSATKVLVLYTGGTIGMTPSDPNNPASPLRPAGQKELAQLIPNPLEGTNPNQHIEWTIEGLADSEGKLVGPLDSSSVGPTHWVYMAAAIERAYDAYDGFVILHGTDTMAFTASALSFLLQNLDKPVVITGSQLPIFRPRTDARLNFINALYIAGYRATGLPKAPEVMICFGDRLLRGNRTTKISTSGWQGFSTPNYYPLGTIGEHIVIEDKFLLSAPTERSPFFAHKSVEESVATIPLYPGIAPAVLEKMLNIDAQGIILRSFGTGNAPNDPGFLDIIRKAIDSGKIIVNTTQCLQGSVEMGLYEASSGLQSVGVITGLDLTPEAALTKLMWLLATEALSEIPTQMQINLRGEQSGSVFDIRYGLVGDSKKPQQVARLSAHPSGQFQTKTLERAVLRLEGVGIDAAQIGDGVHLRAFINLPSAKEDTPENIPQFAGHLTGRYEGPEKTLLLLEITSVVARVHETGRPLNVNLVAPAGIKFWASGVYVTLLNEA